jgi:hypothetical protein
MHAHIMDFGNYTSFPRPFDDDDHQSQQSSQSQQQQRAAMLWTRKECRS